jgi:type III restriction enzyme
MELKTYQTRALNATRKYLEKLAENKAKAPEFEKLLGEPWDFAEKTWKDVGLTGHHSRKTGRGDFLPTVCLKLPTGGGKTLLAVKTIELVGTHYLRRRTGMVLWIVPSTEIFRQTLRRLRDRSDPYRQHLDLASGGKTLVFEKGDRFMPEDVEQNLCVLLLMLPSANRQDKETLRMFKDSGGFDGFFPSDDDRAGHERLAQRVPNLEFFGREGDLLGRQTKTSLGNTLRLLSPLVIVDEGHKAYSDGAQETIRGFNPCLVIELSATPVRERSNILVEVLGRELEKEGMIKLDLHLMNRDSPDWRTTLLAAVEHLDRLEKAARTYEASSGRYIRPIALIQVEQTGAKLEGDARRIHAEHARKHLIDSGIPPEAIRIKSSEKDEIGGEDLLSRDSPVRFIITKQALQEGWDCSFAYVLVALANSTSELAMTQLVGRVLRQPYAKKTKVTLLDESYVFCFRRKADELLAEVKKGFEKEGLGDLSSRITGAGSEEQDGVKKTVKVRPRFKEFAGKALLPVFLVKDGDWRLLRFESDLLSQVDWGDADFSKVAALKLDDAPAGAVDISVGLSDDPAKVIKAKGKKELEADGFRLRPAFVAAQLSDIIPNPWAAHAVAAPVIASLEKANGDAEVARHAVYVVERLRVEAERERDRLAKKVFVNLVEKKKVRFAAWDGEPTARLPANIRFDAGAKFLRKRNDDELERSLFEKVPRDWFNALEEGVALHMDEQQKLLWWFRNTAKQDYGIQGWRKHKVYPDFIFTESDLKDGASRLYVLETKGAHLKNEDTAYKQEIFDFCNKLADRAAPTELGLELAGGKASFHMIHEEDWRPELSAILQSGRRKSGK